MTGISDVMAVRWSKEEHTLLDIFNNNKFPLIVRVMKGYFGDSPIETISSGDMLRIQGRGVQRRAIARDCNFGRYFSIPMDGEIYFRPVNAKGKSREISMRLESLVSVSNLPCTVELDKKQEFSQVGDAGQVEHVMTRLEVQEIYDAKYLLTNAIIEGRLYAEILAVPSYLGATLATAKGLAAGNATSAQWERQLTKWNSAAANINFVSFQYCQEIMMYSSGKVEDSNHIYDTIEPSNYLSLSQVNRSLPENVYETADHCSTGHSKSSHCPTGHTKRSQSIDYVNPQEFKEKLAAYGVTSSGKRPQVSAKPKLTDKKEQRDMHFVYNGPSVIHKVQDIPEDAGKLSCEDLVACLFLMNMSQYAKVFRENQINGELLSSLGEDIMVGDLSISKIHARKLALFLSDGWRPDASTTNL